MPMQNVDTVPEKHCVALRARDSFAAKRKQAATPDWHAPREANIWRQSC
jgi:hypothetical protein